MDLPVLPSPSLAELARTAVARAGAAAVAPDGRAEGPAGVASVRAAPDGHLMLVFPPPRGLDRYGLELVAVTSDGAASVRLSFPGGPVRSFASIPPPLRALLVCRCLALPTAREFSAVLDSRTGSPVR